MEYPKKGEIYLVNFDPTISHETKKKRPAVILSNDIHNQYSLLVTVAPLSSNAVKIYPFEIKLGKDSVFNQPAFSCYVIRKFDSHYLFFPFYCYISLSI